jgi:hypothetical protein
MQRARVEPTMGVRDGIDQRLQRHRGSGCRGRLGRFEVHPEQQTVLERLVQCHRVRQAMIS